MNRVFFPASHLHSLSAVTMPATATNNGNSSTADGSMPDNKTLYVFPAMGDLDFVQSGNITLTLLPGGTEPARSMLDYPEGDKARSIICALQELANTCRGGFSDRFPKGSVDMSELTQEDWENWKRDTTVQLTKKLRDLLTAEPGQYVGEQREDESRGGSSNLQHGPKITERTVTHQPLQVKLIDEATWMRWNNPPSDPENSSFNGFGNLLPYRFSKTPAEAEKAWLAASLGATTHPSTTVHPVAAKFLRATKGEVGQ